MRCKYCGEIIVAEDYFSAGEVEILSVVFDCDCKGSQAANNDAKSALTERTRSYIINHLEGGRKC